MRKNGIKKLFLLTACTLGFSFFQANQAHALRCELLACASTIAGDGGVTIKKCTAIAPGDECGCNYIGTSCETKTVSAGSSCGTGWGFLDNYIDGRKCCIRNCALNQNEFEQEVMEIVSKDSAGMTEIFGNEPVSPSLFAAAHFGFVNGTNRSPTDGRLTLPEAAMDACMGHTDVTYLQQNFSAGFNRWNACVNNTTYGCTATAKNEHCLSTGINDGSSVSAAVCKDRCDCAFGQGTYGTCENN